MNEFYCKIKSVYRSLKTFQPSSSLNFNISGHSFIESEVYKNKTVYIYYCEDCGKVQIRWK